MRLPLLVLLVMLAWVPAASAQGLSYGVKAGVNLSSISFEPDDSGNPYESRVGWLAGAFATIPLRGWLSLQPEALYTIKGARVDFESVESQLIVDYFEVPILARVSLRRGFYAVAGPTVAARIKARSRTKFGGSTEEIDLEDDIERVDLGVAAGAGMELGRWLFEGRYTHGLSDIDAEAGETAKVRNRTISLSAGIRF